MKVHFHVETDKSNGDFGRAGWHVLSEHQTLNQERKGLIKVEMRALRKKDRTLKLSGSFVVKWNMVVYIYI